MMLVGVLLILLVMAGGGVLLYADADRARTSTTRRLKLLSAPPPKARVTEADSDVRTEPWLPYVPARYRDRVNDMLGATGYKLKLFHCAIIAIVGFLLVAGACLLLHLPIYIVVVAAILVGGFVPLWMIIGFMQKRHADKFLRLFPDAIDLIVRAVRAGLPVAGSLEAVGRETPDPVGIEFRLLVADLRIGLDLDEALQRAAARIRLADFSFFTASLILQRESGGNLSETLQILSNVLRRRMELRLKTQAMIAEAKTSAYVLGALPFLAAFALMFLNPGYIGTFVKDPHGGYIIGAAAAMMIMGALVMRAMIQNAMR